MLYLLFFILLLILLFFIIFLVKTKENWNSRGWGRWGRWRKNGWKNWNRLGRWNYRRRGPWFWSTYWDPDWYPRYKIGDPWCYNGKVCYPTSLEELHDCFPEIKNWDENSEEWKKVRPGEMC